MRTSWGSHFSFLFVRVLSMARSHFFEGIENFRDLGGYGCDYGTTEFGVVFRSATPINATKEDLDKVASIGIKTIVDLRGEEYQKEEVNPFAKDGRFKVIDLEVNGNGRIAKDRDDYIASYMEMVEDPSSARKILLSILHAPKPVLFHCNAGKDRTGVFSLLLLGFAGVHVDDINADYMLSFPHLRKMTRETRANRPFVPELLLVPDIEFIPDFYDAFIKRYGSFRNYGEVIGLSEDEIEALANLLGKQEKSCGAVCFKENKVLIEHSALGHYSFPRGHVEEYDEDDYATAIREIKEETGFDAQIIPGFEETIVYSPYKGIIKYVRIFLAEIIGGERAIQKEEVSDIYFLTPEEAMYVLSHDNDRKVVAKAAKHYAIN